MSPRSAEFMHQAEQHLALARHALDGGFPFALLTTQAANEARKLREGADYEAADVSTKEAERILALGESFIAAIEELLEED